MGKERQPSMEIDPHMLEGFVDTFIPRFDAYPLQLDDGTYITIKAPLTRPLVEAHFRGDVTLGAYALDKQSQAKYICFDGDDDDEWHGLLNMVSELAQSSVPAYIEPSRRGGHIWLFTPKIEGLNARRFGKQLLREHGVKLKEIYPRQAKLSTGVGSFVRLPLGIHRKTGKRYYFVNLDGTPLAPTIRDQIAVLADPDRVSLGFIQEVIARTPPPRPKDYPSASKFKQPSRDLLPSERIKAAISTYDFVTRYVEVDKNGKGVCPFHDDHRPSFQVSQSGDLWTCYADCGGGDLIAFWQKMRERDGKDDSFKATLAELMGMLFGD